MNIRSIVGMLCFLLCTAACSDDSERVAWTDFPREEQPVDESEEDLPTVVETHGKLSICGKRLVDENGDPVQLRGVSYPWHNWWPGFFNALSVEYFVRQWQCSVIRVPLGVEKEKGYLEQPEALEKFILPVVEAAIEAGVYVIIDWHAHEIHRDEATAFFDSMSRRYAGKPVLYEIFNEPWGDDYTWAEVKEYAVDIMTTIRKNDPKGIILVGSPRWDTAIEDVQKDPIAGFDNFAYTVHFYAKTTPNTWTAQFAFDHDLPVFISECGGMSADGQDDPDEAAWKGWVEWLKVNKVSWCAWTVPYFVEGGKTPETYKGAFYGWSESDLTDWGKMVREGIMDK